VAERELALQCGLLEYRAPAYVDINTMMELCESVAESHRLPIAAVEKFSALSYAGFLEHARNFNDPKYRYLMIFHRSPLFFCAQPPAARMEQASAVHWSPVVSYDTHTQLICVLDVNDSYGPWLVHAEALYRAVNVRCWVEGEPMGFVRLTLQIDDE
jgi:hypothetical protein